MEETSRTKPWHLVTLAGISISVSITAGSIIYFLCSDYMAQALWERASEISGQGMVPDESRTGPDESDKRDAFRRSAIAVADRLLITAGWSSAFGLALFMLLHFCTRGRATATYQDKLDEIRWDFKVLADEVEKARPPQTKKQWEEERKIISGKIEGYKSLAQWKLRQIERDFPRATSLVGQIQQVVMAKLDSMANEMSHNHDEKSEQREQLRKTAMFAYEISVEIEQRSNG